MRELLKQSIATRDPGLGESAVGMLFSFLDDLFSNYLQFLMERLQCTTSGSDSQPITFIMLHSHISHIFSVSGKSRFCGIVENYAQQVNNSNGANPAMTGVWENI